MSFQQQQPEPAAAPPSAAPQPPPPPQAALMNGMPPGSLHPFATGSLQGMMATGPAPLQDKTASTLLAAATDTAPKPAVAAPVLPAATATANAASVSVMASVAKPPIVTTSSQEKKIIPPEAAEAIAMAPPIVKVNPPTVIPNDDEKAEAVAATTAEPTAAPTPMEVTTTAPAESIPSPKPRKRAAAKSIRRRPVRAALEPSPPAPVAVPLAKKADDEKPLSTKMYAKKTAVAAPKKKVAAPKKKVAAPTKKALTAPAKPKSKSTAPLKGGASGLMWEGSPDEPLPTGSSWPTGWIKRVFERRNGATKGQSDRYWYTPIQHYKLRSMVEVKRFLAALKASKGDEPKAKQTMKNY